MSRLLSTEPVEVRIGECECEGTPHPEGDVALLRPRLLPGDAIAAMSVFQSGRAATEMQRDYGMVLLRGGLVGWNIEDDGKVIPLDALDSGALDWETTLRLIADKADDLYSEGLLRPLVDAMKKSSPDGPTET